VCVCVCGAAPLWCTAWCCTAGLELEFKEILESAFRLNPSTPGKHTRISVEELEGVDQRGGIKKLRDVCAAEE
jgi:hypothetical protein